MSNKQALEVIICLLNRINLNPAEIAGVNAAIRELTEKPAEKAPEEKQEGP